jgi:hypothetical protein
MEGRGYKGLETLQWRREGRKRKREGSDDVVCTVRETTETTETRQMCKTTYLHIYMPLDRDTMAEKQKYLREIWA